MVDWNRNEWEVMRVLWESGAQKPADIQDAFSWPIDNGTLRSVLRVLVGDGHVARRRQGKAFYYRAAKTRRNALSATARRLARIFSGGSSADLIAQMITIERLSQEEIDELRQIAEEKASNRSGERS